MTTPTLTLPEALHFTVAGTCCARCATDIRTRLDSIPAVRDVDVVLTGRRLSLEVIVEGDSVSEVARVMAEGGYQPAPYDQGAGGSAGDAGQRSPDWCFRCWSRVTAVPRR